jgi:serine/threonine protein kinase
MLSDFGTSRDTLSTAGPRTGNTGTLEFAAPETIRRAPGSGTLRPADSRADMWSLGMVLHMLLFLALPFGSAAQYVRNGAALTGPERLEALESEILGYPGFVRTMSER